MHKLLAATILLIGAPAAVAAQSGSAEREVRDFLAEYDKAVAARDIAFLERVLPSDYVFAGRGGRKSDRAQVLRFFTRQRDQPSFRMISLEHTNVVVRVAGTMAVVTNDYASLSAPIDDPGAEPEPTRGRHTGVLERRNGHWMVIAEHDSEQVFDDEWMVAGVLRAARQYQAVMQRLQDGAASSELARAGDIAALGRLLADEYTCTSPEGEFLDKAADIQQATSRRASIQGGEVSDQHVRTIGNGLAIETGKITAAASDAGVPPATARRYTRTWAFYDGRWQVTAHHISLVGRSSTR